MIGKDLQQDEAKEKLEPDYDLTLWHRQQAKEKEQRIKDDHPYIPALQRRIN